MKPQNYDHHTFEDHFTKYEEEFTFLLIISTFFEKSKCNKFPKMPNYFSYDWVIFNVVRHIVSFVMIAKRYSKAFKMQQIHIARY